MKYDALPMYIYIYIGVDKTLHMTSSKTLFVSLDY